jgi:RimJ/RimL family protein N-acetyltransferase
VDDDATIQTARLALVCLSDATLAALHDGDVAGASSSQGIDFGDEFLASVNAAFLSIHLEGRRRHPSARGWFVRAVRRREDGALVGHCGFHGHPTDVGRAEIGYTIFAPYRGRGYATECARALVRWAHSQGEESVVAAVAASNAPSIAVVTNAGFRRVGRQVGRGEDEYVFAASASSDANPETSHAPVSFDLDQTPEP